MNETKPTPEPPADDLRERIARAAACAYMRVPVEAMDPRIIIEPMWPEVADAVLAVLPPLAPEGMTAERLRDAAVWVRESGGVAGELAAESKENLRRWADALGAVPSPTPPWPGAVLSGLVDEDGQPTWLAQVISVRGEWIRCAHALGWTKTHGYRPTEWVEVRAPRPAAATERVQALEAVKDGRQVVGASSPFEAHYIWRGGPDRAFIGERTMDKAVLVAPDGTVEVLRRDGES